MDKKKHKKNKKLQFSKKVSKTSEFKDFFAKFRIYFLENH